MGFNIFQSPTPQQNKLIILLFSLASDFLEIDDIYYFKLEIHVVFSLILVFKYILDMVWGTLKFINTYLCCM